VSIKNSHLFVQVSVYANNKIEFGSEEIEDLTLYGNTYTFDHGLRYKSDIEPMIYFGYFPNLKKLNLFISFSNSDKKSSIDIGSFRKLANLEVIILIKRHT